MVVNIISNIRYIKTFVVLLSDSKSFDIASSLKSKNAQLTVEVDRLKEENTRLSEQG